MKKSRKLLLQILMFIPAMVFLLIYTDRSVLYVGIALFFAILLLFSFYQYFNQKEMFNYPLWVGFVGSFYLYAFIGLGNTHVPQTFRSISEYDSPILFDLNTSHSVDKICYYVGIDKNVNFTLEYQKKGQWQKFYTYANSYPYSFRWRCLHTGIHTSKILFRVTKNKMMLNEVHFFSQGEDIPYKSSTNMLNDEPKMNVDTCYYSGMYFDEIYHGRAAYEIMNGMDVYENTHPYLGKMLLIPGIKLFGMTPFGWRVDNVLFAGVLIYLMYYLALLLFKEKLYAFGASFLLTYSFMHLAQARMAHIDTFSVCFVLLSYIFLYKFLQHERISQLFVSGIFFGLASAVKWSAVFSLVGIGLLFLYLLIFKHPILKRFSALKLFLYGIYSYLLIGGLVYLLSFPDIYLKSGGLQHVIDYNLNMYHYHTTMTQTHPYSSSWWSWPLDIKPMGYYKQISHGMLSSINAFGNPAIFWMGIVAVFYLFFALLKRATLEIAIILFAFIGLYLPYVFVGRLMFIYHFYYAVPFLVLAIVAMFKDLILWKPSAYGIFIGYLCIVAGLFLLFYPVLSGHEIEVDYVNKYLRWFSSWWF